MARAQAPAFEVLFHVARRGGTPVASQAYLAEQLAQANRVFADTGVRFRQAGLRPLAGPAELHSRADRHRLGQWVQPEVINVFVVGYLRDVDEPQRRRQGVHWRPRGYPGTHLLILAAYASDYVLAHELGHFFGNREHSPTPGNVMSYQRGKGVPFFDARQKARVRESAQLFRRSGELR